MTYVQAHTDFKAFTVSANTQAIGEITIRLGRPGERLDCIYCTRKDARDLIEQLQYAINDLGTDNPDHGN